MRLTSKITLPIAIMLVVALSILTWQVQSNSSKIISSLATDKLKAVSGQYGNDVKSFFEMSLNETQALADAISYTISEGQTPSREMVINMLIGIEKGNDNFMAAGSAWEPNAYDRSDYIYANQTSLGSDANGRFIPYVAGGQPVTTLENLEQSAYYSLPKSRKQTSMIDPDYYSVGGKDVLMTTASAVIKHGNDFKGIVLLDINLEKVQNMVEGIKLYDTGWGALLNQSGLIIAHKDKNLVLTNLFQSSQVEDKEGLKKAMAAGQPFMEIHDSGDGEDFYSYYPINFSLTGQTWYFMVSVPSAEVLASVAVIRNITVIISLVTLLFAIAIAFVVVRRNVKPLGMIADGAGIVAGGNFDVKIDHSKWSGEAKELCIAIETMIGSLVENIENAKRLSEDANAKAAEAEVAKQEAEAAQRAAESAKREGMLAAAAQLQDVVGIVSSASEELSAQIAQSESGAAAQAASVAETATAMEEMNSTVLEVARSAAMAAQATMESKEKAVEGSKIVEQAVEGIRDVQAVAMALKSDMENLASQAEAISDIMSVISDIADQTNLLALNAAIEAARAGEAGRGFAVVADEVRKLAEKTMTSTADVGNAITNIQKSVEISMQQTDKAAQLVETATERSAKSGEALNEIVGIVENAADQVQSIATASEQQSATSEEINRSISEVNSIAEQTSTAMQEAAQAVSELATQANALSRLIEEMKNS